MKKSILTILYSVVLFTVNMVAETIYTRTTHIAMVGDCFVFQTTFWGNNNTSETTADDRYLGVDYLMDCPEKLPGFVPDFTNPYFHPETVADLQKFDLIEEGKFVIPSIIPYIPYEEYLEKNKRFQASLIQLETTPVAPEPIKTIRIIESKKE